jgi:hypothetical protein
MKTTVEISDDLLKRSQRLAKLRGTTLRAILEEGLRLALNAHRQRRAEKFELPTFGESSLTSFATLPGARFAIRFRAYRMSSIRRQ